MANIPNRQSLVFNERSQLSQAIPQFSAERTLHQRTPIVRFELQLNEPGFYERTDFCVLGACGDRTTNER